MMNSEDPASQPAGKRRFKLLRRFGKDKRGSTAIEFVLLIFPFTLMMFAVIETGLSFASQQIMSNTTDDVARSLRVNEIAQIDATPAAIRDLICSKIEIMVSAGCPGLSVDLRTYNNFSEVPLTIPRTGSGDLDTSGFAIAPGGSGSKNQLRIFYKWPVMTDFMRKYLAGLPDGKTLLYSTLTWQNEDYL
jgi:Flp pilus assembly protein TadG